MAHQYSRVDFNLSVEVKEDNLSLYYGGVKYSNYCDKFIICTYRLEMNSLVAYLAEKENELTSGWS